MEKTFKILAKVLGNQSFSRANNNRTKLTSMFIVYQFESFTLGIQKHLDKLDISTDEKCEELKSLFMEIKLNETYISLTTGGGKNTPTALSSRVNFVSDKIAESLVNGH